MLDVLDADGMSLRQVLQAAGVLEPEAAVRALALLNGSVHAYIEPHIEQVSCPPCGTCQHSLPFGGDTAYAKSPTCVR
jgi:hypothetical protein